MEDLAANVVILNIQMFAIMIGVVLAIGALICIATAVSEAVHCISIRRAERMRRAQSNV